MQIKSAKDCGYITLQQHGTLTPFAVKWVECLAA
jgi:hypothetical protein